MKDFEIEIRKVQNGYIIYQRIQLGCIGNQYVAETITDLMELVGKLADEHEDSVE